MKNRFTIKKNYFYVRGSRKDSREEYHENNTIRTKRQVTDDGFSKLIETMNINGRLSGRLNKFCRGESLMKLWEKYQNYNYEEKVTENGNRIVGKIMCSDSGDKYEAN